MKLRFLAASNGPGGTALVCAAALLPGAALAATAAPASPAATSVATASSLRAGIATAAAAGAVLAELATKAPGKAPAGKTRTGTTHSGTGGTNNGHPSRNNIPHCQARQTQIWMGIPGSGTPRKTFFPLEFTNISKHHACKIWGFPRVTANGQHGKIGKPALYLGKRTHVVVLRPGQTAHARLGIIQAGHVCRKPVWTFGLKLLAPHQGRSTFIPYGFQACFHERVLIVGPVKPGIGIP